MSMYSKVMATAIDMNGINISLYGIERPEPEYVKPKIILGILQILIIFVIPIVFFIGLIIYFKKSKSSVGKKLLMTLISLAILVLIVMGINYIITNML